MVVERAAGTVKIGVCAKAREDATMNASANGLRSSFIGASPFQIRPDQPLMTEKATLMVPFSAEEACVLRTTMTTEPAAGVTNPEVLVERITNPKTPARLKGYALRLAPPTHKALTLELLRDFANSDDEVLQLEAVRTLAVRRASTDIAADDKRSPQLRAEAILGTDDPVLLQKLAQSDHAIIRDEAQRALPRSITTNRPAFDDTAAWLKILEGQGDAETGRRIFFNSKVALCSSCHRHSGRGNVVGPDLTLIAQQGDRAAILRSILEPHREVAPQFYPYVVELKDGTTFTGILLRSSSTEVFRDLTGKEKSFPEADILKRTELRTSLMPPGLVMSLTDAELRDLLTFLTER